ARLMSRDLETVYSILEELMQVAESKDLHRGFHEEDLFTQWEGMMTVVTETEDEDVDVSSYISERFKIRTIGMALAEAKTSFQAWATKKMWKSTLGVPHRCARGAIDEPGEIITPAPVFSFPNEVMDYRADKWQKVLSSPSFSPSKVLKGVEYVNLRAKKRKGADATGPVEVQRLPDEATEELKGFHAAIETHYMWLGQVSVVIGAVALKRRGGDRVLGLLRFLVKLWAKVRSSEARPSEGRLRFRPLWSE
ncbi:unnamed protein product, partial [Prorocentrum cordatum]